MFFPCVLPACWFNVFCVIGLLDYDLPSGNILVFLRTKWNTLICNLPQTTIQMFEAQLDTFIPLCLVWLWLFTVVLICPCLLGLQSLYVFISFVLWWHRVLLFRRWMLNSVPYMQRVKEYCSNVTSHPHEQRLTSDFCRVPVGNWPTMY